MRAGGPHPVLAVLGAINVDLVVSGAPLPKAGETVTGGTFARHHGGKGGNQAVAAARALRPPGRVLPAGRTEPPSAVWMVGAVGDEQLGVEALDALREEGVRTEHVMLADGETGVALIAVGPDGENQISVAPGANLMLDTAHAIEALEELQPDLVLASAELAEPTVGAVLEWCDGSEVPVVLNPAPLQPWVRSVIRFATYLTPNRLELEELGEIIPAGTAVIETRGDLGARIHAGDDGRDIPAPPVAAIDSTGAGDCFNGVLAARLAGGAALDEAVRDAVVAASLSTTVPGAREGMPETQAVLDARQRFGI